MRPASVVAGAVTHEALHEIVVVVGITLSCRRNPEIAVLGVVVVH